MSGERPMTDAELTALAALVIVDAVEVQRKNAQRLAFHAAPPHSLDTNFIQRLRAELHRRGVLK